jgi:tagaturonate reductase
LASLLRFYKGALDDSGNFVCEWNGKKIKISDEASIVEFFRGLADMKDISPRDYVKQVLSNESLWSMDLTKIKGMTDKVTTNLEMILDGNYDSVLQKILEK